MILRTLEVEGFRCFDRTVQLNGISPGLNVVSGPNGAGKTTLLRALRHVLVDAHGLTGAVVKQAMAPWGRALSPRICVTIEHGGEQWRLEKRFLSATFTRLERLEQGVFRPLAEGKEAEARVRAMLQADAAAKGLASESHLGLLQVLWTPQGPPLLPAWSPGVRTTLQEAFGAALSSRAAAELAKRIEARFDEYFTPTGQVKKSSPVTPLRAEAAQLREQHGNLLSQWQLAGQNRDAIAELRRRVEGESERLAALLPELERAGAHQRQVAEATSAELRARQAFDAVETRLRQWREDVAAEQRTKQLAAETAARHAQLEEELAAATAMLPEIQALEDEQAALRKEGDDAREWPAATRARQLAAERQTLSAHLAAIAVPADIAVIRRLRHQLDLKRAALSAASLKLTIQAEAPLTMESEGATDELAEGSTREWVSPLRVSVHVAGVGRITAASANAQAAGLAAEVEKLSAQLDAMLRGDTMADVERRAEEWERARRELELLEAEARPLEALKAEYADLLARHPDWERTPPDLAALREAWKSRKEIIEAKRTRYNLPALSAGEASARTSLAECKRQLEQIAARLAQHAAAGPFDVLESTHKEAGLALAAARAQLEALRLAVPTNLASLEDSVQRLRASMAEGKEAAARLEGELAAQQSRNLYTHLAETEERLAECDAALDRESRRAAALELLRSTLRNAQAELTSSLPSQIAEQATLFWRRIAGAEAPSIRVDQSWTPAGLQVPGASAAMEELSGGEAEQVAFATRLALATQLARGQRMLAVFDDSFLATDPARAHRVLELLSEAAESLQIVVLTCHPGRYENLPCVRHFDLEKLKQ